MGKRRTAGKLNAHKGSSHTSRPQEVRNLKPGNFPRIIETEASHTDTKLSRDVFVQLIAGAILMIIGTAIQAFGGNLVSPMSEMALRLYVLSVLPF
jgi:hypothetical protein